MIEGAWTYLCDDCKAAHEAAELAADTCDCVFAGDMADASGCELHGNAIPRKPVASSELVYGNDGRFWRVYADGRREVK
jgi:hypothetical protein